MSRRTHQVEGQVRDALADRREVATMASNLAEEVIALQQLTKSTLGPADYDYYTELSWRLSILADLVRLSPSELLDHARKFVDNEDRIMDTYRKHPRRQRTPKRGVL